MRIMVTPGYTVAPQYLDGGDDEMLCSDCLGRGEIRMEYGPPGVPERRHRCYRCAGEGKLKAACRECGKPHMMVRHKDRDLDAFCSGCLFERARARRAQAQEVGT